MMKLWQTYDFSSHYAIFATVEVFARKQHFFLSFGAKIMQLAESATLFTRFKNRRSFEGGI